jgi:mRNA interferase MazF
VVIARGEIWWADLGAPRGSAPALRRPVLVVSDDRYNASRLRTVTVAIFTSTARLAALPGNVAVSAELSGLDKDSVLNVTQVATIDRAALEQRAGQLPAWLMTQVDEGLRRALAL